MQQKQKKTRERREVPPLYVFEWCAAQGWSAEDLIRAALRHDTTGSVSSSAIKGVYYRDSKRPEIFTVLAISDALGCGVRDLLSPPPLSVALHADATLTAASDTTETTSVADGAVDVDVPTS